MSIKTSASSIKELTSCSLSWYYNRVLRIPQRVWSRTVIGSLCHSIFESLSNPRHRHHYDLITAPGTSVDYTLSAPLARLVRTWKDKHSISDELITDLNGMLYVGLVLVDFFFTKAVKVYPPEYEFTLDLGDGVEVRGFIDRMADMGDFILLRDYKSQRNRFTAKELSESIQAWVYQLVCLQMFGKPARVEFIMLRHPPGKRSPERHIQIVEPSTPSQLAGLREYLKDVGKQTESFGLEEALRHPHSDPGFCSNVCSFYAPLDYWALVPRDNPTITTPLKTFALDRPPQDDYYGTDQVLVRRQHLGCLARYPQPSS